MASFPLIDVISVRQVFVQVDRFLLSRITLSDAYIFVNTTERIIYYGL